MWFNSVHKADFIQLILKFVPDEVDGLPDELVIPTSLAAKKNSKF